MLRRLRHPPVAAQARRGPNPSPAAAGTHRRAAAAAAHLLSAEQVGRYHRDGYLLPGLGLDAGQLGRGRGALDALLADNPHVQPELLVNAHLADGGGTAQGVKGSRTLLELAALPALVNLVAQCLGTENVILWACQVFCKPPGEGKSVPYHQDGQYWPIEPLRACTAWVALDASDVGNGCLRVLPGTHRHGQYRHVRRADDEACIEFVADPKVVSPLLAGAVPLELEPGQVSLHDSMLLHGSERNTSQRRRVGMAATYMPAECHFNRKAEPPGAKLGGIKLEFSRRPLFVVKGINQNPLNDQLRTV